MPVKRISVTQIRKKHLFERTNKEPSVVLMHLNQVKGKHSVSVITQLKTSSSSSQVCIKVIHLFPGKAYRFKVYIVEFFDLLAKGYSCVSGDQMASILSWMESSACVF